MPTCAVSGLQLASVFGIWEIRYLNRLKARRNWDLSCEVSGGKIVASDVVCFGLALSLCECGNCNLIIGLQIVKGMKFSGG